MTEEIESQAAEYVLGTLSAEERTRFAALLATSEEARQAVAAWERRLAPLTSAIEEVAPSPAVWSGIEARIQGASPATTSDAPAAAIAIDALRASRNRWRLGAVAAAALAAGLALFSLDRLLLEQQEAKSTYVAVVNRGGNLPALIIRVDLASHSVFVRPVATEVPQGHSLELWYIGQGKAPKSLGLVDRAERKIPLPAGAKIEKATFAVTIEPKGGSPTGKATGPIVYSGQLLKE